MKLTRQKFTTEDSKGCEFVCELRRTTYYKVIDGKSVFVDEREYSALGIICDNLNELKLRIANL